MTAIEEIASYLPATSTPISVPLGHAGLGDRAQDYERYYGFSRVRIDPGVGIAEQLSAAASALAGVRERAEDIRYVVYAPTIQATAPYPDTPLRQVCQTLGLPRALPFSLTQHACASALLAIEVCGRLLQADRDPTGLALVLAGEKTFTNESRVIPDAAVMGEGIAGVLVSGFGSSNRVLAYAVHTLGEYHQAPFQAEAEEGRFQREYPAAVAAVIEDAVARAGLRMTDIELILPHNVNRMSWLRVLKDLGLSKSHIMLDNQRELGHCFGADPFLNYQTAREQGRLGPGARYVMIAAGLGATLAALVLQS
jgi:3-oxoacyl-[acyl-carrier-protein] synthase III